MAHSDSDIELEVSSPKDVKRRILRMRLRVKRMMDNSKERELRKLFSNCLNFVMVPGNQWDDYTKQARGDKRPHYEFDRARVTAKRIINNMRANRPQGKVRGFEDDDRDLAEIHEGLLRNIANSSGFENITDTAAEYQVIGGYAAWRWATKYCDNSIDEQEMLIESIRNPLCLWCDESAYDMTGADAKDWVLIDTMSPAEFKRRYPKAKAYSFDAEGLDDSNEWRNDDLVRVAQYWWKEPYDKTIHLLSDGKTIDSSELEEAIGRGLSVVKSRTYKSHKIMSAIYSGDAELEPPSEFPGENFPWIRVYGEFLVIDGQCYWAGLTPYIMDAQRAFNLGMTSAYESVARASVSQVWATPTQANGLEKHWASADKQLLPFQLYNPDPAAPGPPVRMGGADVPVAQIQMAQLGAEEIKANSGIFDSSLGDRSNETSGVAISRRNEQGEIATYNFQDNMAKAVKRTWEIGLGMIPIVIDTPRAIRILGADDSEKYVKVNQPDINGEVLNDLSRGKFDVVVSVGPSFMTKRQEASESYTQLAQSDPTLMQTAGDLVFKALDLPYADEIAERKKAMLPPPILAMINKDQKQSPEVMQAMMQAEQAMAMVQEQGKMVEAAAAEATQLKTEAEKEQAQIQVMKSDVQIAMANLKTEEANFKTMQAQFEAQVAEFKVKTQSDMMQLQQGQDKADGTNAENSAALEQIQQAAMALQQMSESFLQQAAELIMTANQQSPIVIEKARPVGVKAKRVNGELVGTVMYEDGTEKQVKASRVNGELTSTIQ